MKLLDPVPEPVMVAAFLKAEFFSQRFAGELRVILQRLSVDDSVIVTPDVGDNDENETRARVLGEYRGYRQNREIFTDFPTDLQWYRAELSREEISHLRYVDYSYWNELTDHSHLVKDAVKNIRGGKVIFNVSNDRFWRVADKIQQGNYNFEAMILWRKDKNKNSPTTIIEGHLRATAFGLAGDRAPQAIPVILGIKRQSGSV